MTSTLDSPEVRADRVSLRSGLGRPNAPQSSLLQVAEQREVVVRDAVPVVEAALVRLAGRSDSVQLLGIVQEALPAPHEIVAIVLPIQRDAAAGRVAVFGYSVHEAAHAGRHGREQRGRSALESARRDVHARIDEELFVDVPVLIADRTELFALARPYRVAICGGIVVPDDHQTKRRAESLERVDELLHAFLGDDPADEDAILACLEAKTGQNVVGIIRTSN